MEECFICGWSHQETKRKTFMVLGHWITDFICQVCFECPGDYPPEPMIGKWEDINE